MNMLYTRETTGNIDAIGMIDDAVAVEEEK